ncbi:hypothetical protein N7G274_010492 [Stereocaulon virgatum]|uniref:Heterokaryon incompatibility domain-containing protein n=1 Tax=Stereocaulon virgatum TaxID=373712 RepID=A0ABR3ZVJ8_9LECA
MLIHSASSKLGESVPYVTLSHHWGRQPIITTILATLATREKSIPMPPPQTFRDVVIIPRKMNVQYLWLDSLCIVQDPKADWEAEAAEMGDHYRQSLFTISAAGAEDNSVGCFMPRDPRLVRPCVLDLNFEGGGGEREAPVNFKAHVRPRDDVGPWWRRAYSSLDRRGWVM